MGTRSLIGILNADGSVDGIYCHWDGYPEHNGRILLQHYNTEAGVRALLSLGDLRSLGERLAPDADSPHSFDQRQDGVCVAYGRDRGESGAEQRHCDSITSFIKSQSDAEYIYLFIRGEWFSVQVINDVVTTLRRMLEVV